VQISIIICLLSSYFSADEKNNDYTNVHHTVVKNGRFINYFSCIKFQKYVSVIFSEQIGLYYANEQ